MHEKACLIPIMKKQTRHMKLPTHEHNDEIALEQLRGSLKLV